MLSTIRIMEPGFPDSILVLDFDCPRRYVRLYKRKRSLGAKVRDFCIRCENKVVWLKNEGVNWEELKRRSREDGVMERMRV